MSDRDRVIRASEVGLYTYCARAWWLGAVRGQASSHVQEMATGEAAHRRHGRGVTLAFWLSRLAYALLLLAAVVGVGWLAG